MGSIVTRIFQAWVSEDFIAAKGNGPQQEYDEPDGFKLSMNKNSGIPWILKNLLNELLIARPEERVACFKPVADAKEHATFYLNMYGENSNERNGLPVIISCKIGKQNYVLEAKNNSISVEECHLPQKIETKTSGLIFYAQQNSDGKDYIGFESSLNKGSYLAWNSEKTLILKTKVQIDETTSFMLIEKNPDTY